MFCYQVPFSTYLEVYLVAAHNSIHRRASATKYDAVHGTGRVVEVAVVVCVVTLPILCTWSFEDDSRRRSASVSEYIA